MPNFIHYIGTVFLFVATVLLIFASISTPVYHKVNFLDGTVINQSILMGNWGTCIANDCTKARLGYDFPSFTNLLTGDARLGASIVHGLTYALVLNPIAAGLSFVAFILALSTHLALGIAASIAAFLAFLVTAIALIVDLALFVTARDRLNRIDEVHVTLGNAMWFVTAALALQFIASFLVCCTHHRNRRARNTNYNSTYNNTVLVADPNLVNSPTHSTVPLHPEMTQTKNKWYQRNNFSRNNGNVETGGGAVI